MRLSGDQLRSSIGARPERPVTGPRQADDYYRTHPSVLEALLRVEHFEGPVLEPACGDGILAEFMISYGFEVLAADLINHGYGASGWDFLTMRSPSYFHDIITNPPYKIMDKFALRALEVTPPGGKVALLGRILWLEGTRRYHDVFSSHPPRRVWILSKRPLLAKGDGEFRSGLLGFAWFVFEVGHDGPTTLGWI